MSEPNKPNENQDEEQEVNQGKEQENGHPIGQSWNPSPEPVERPIGNPFW